jgi:hypothetical protein
MLKEIVFTVGINLFPHDLIIVKHLIEINVTKSPFRQLQQKAKFLGGIPDLQSSQNSRRYLEAKQKDKDQSTE